MSLDVVSVILNCLVVLYALNRKQSKMAALSSNENALTCPSCALQQYTWLFCFSVSQQPFCIVCKVAYYVFYFGYCPYLSLLSLVVRNVVTSIDFGHRHFNNRTHRMHVHATQNNKHHTAAAPSRVATCLGARDITIQSNMASHVAIAEPTAC